MKHLRIAALALCLSILFAPFAFAGEWDKNFVALQLGDNTVIAASATNTGIYRVPQDAQIDRIYLTSASAVASDASNYVTLTFYLNNSSYGTLTTCGTTAGAVSLVATTPSRLTPTGVNLTAGDIIQFKLTKGGSGAAMTDPGVTLSYFNTTSR